MPKIRKIPLRLMNRPAGSAQVIGRCATWHCVCGDPIALQGRSGRASGPTRDSVVTCPTCARVYFVIPLDRSHGPPIEVVELFGLPEETPRNDSASGSHSGAGETAPNAPASNVSTM